VAKHRKAGKGRLIFDAVIAFAARWVGILYSWAKKLVHAILWAFGAIVIALLLIFLGQWIFETPRDSAYRFLISDKPCEAKTALFETDNNEADAYANLGKNPQPNPLQCSLQLHTFPSADQSKPEISYYLSFVEFDEEGGPSQKGLDGNLLPASWSQMDVLKQHLLLQKKNYVLVFVHGWRHDASIGDSNVANTRLFAAYAKSFLNQRCKLDSSFCDVTVTAVYIGWRGARVDENKVGRFFRHVLGKNATDNLNTVLAFSTLYDRKPVSEAVAPAVISDLRLIDYAIHRQPDNTEKSGGEFNRMIVFGHSLGGNLLASALKDTMIAIVRRHQGGAYKVTPKINKEGKIEYEYTAVREPEIVRPPFGNLVVLLNPASEAYKWTEIQRAMREKIPFRSNEEISDADLTNGHIFFSNRQPPIYIAITAANSWPVGGIRLGDISPDSVGRDLKCNAERRVGYDWATDEVFSVFKWDFRPAADTLEKIATTVEDPACPEATRPPGWIWRKIYYRTARIIRNFPFMQTNAEYSRAIGHLNPLRPPFGHLLGESFIPSTDFGTTHELTVNQPLTATEQAEDYGKRQYSYAAHPVYSECDRSNGWLLSARKRNSPFGAMWDSGYKGGSDQHDDKNLTPVRNPKSGEYVESQFRHGYFRSGMDPIVRANDPFWNVRAFDSAMRDHDGYISYPFICAIHQLVLDDVANEPKK
jgi:hypothetical protein